MSDKQKLFFHTIKCDRKPAVIRLAYEVESDKVMDKHDTSRCL